MHLIRASCTCIRYAYDLLNYSLHSIQVILMKGDSGWNNWLAAMNLEINDFIYFLKKLLNEKVQRSAGY